MTDRDDEGNKQCVRSAYSLIETLVGMAQDNMRDGGRADLVNFSLRAIERAARQAQEFPWPDPRARGLAAAKCDRTLQKLIKKASRKTPI